MTICKRQYLRQIYELVEQGSAGWIRPKLVTLWKISASKTGSGFSAYEFYSFLNVFITSERCLKVCNTKIRVKLTEVREEYEHKHH